jgi:pimeloyl-ACP methyl ester carboxylesterase
VLPELERHHDVLAPTLVGHAGGPKLDGDVSGASIPDAIERAMDEAGFETAHMVGNSLGGYAALQLAARGRAESVVALAPAGGWAEGDESYKETLGFFTTMQDQVRAAAPHAEALMASVEGRRRATEFITVNFEHIPAELLAHQIRGVADCEAVVPMVEYVTREGYSLDAEGIICPVRIVWGTEDRLLPWPAAAERLRKDWLPHADWVELEGIGHCPQLDIPLETAQLIVGFTAQPDPR